LAELKGGANWLVTVGQVADRLENTQGLFLANFVRNLVAKGVWLAWVIGALGESSKVSFLTIDASNDFVDSLLVCTQGVAFHLVV